MYKNFYILEYKELLRKCKDQFQKKVLAVALKIAIDDIVGVTPIYQGIHIDPMMHSPQNLNSDSEAKEDVNGVEVPNDSISGNENRKGGG